MRTIFFESENAAIVAALPVGLVIVDENGCIALTNPAMDEMFGYAPGALQGERIEVLLPLRSRAGHPGLRNSYMAAPDKRMMGAGRDLLAMHSSGKEFPVEVALTPISHNGQRGALAIVTDISVRKKLEHELRQANAKLEEFTYIASHDLRSPLRGIADLLEWIEEDIAPEAIKPSVKNNFDRARQRINRAERMIENLLTYAKSGARNYDKEQVNLRGLLDEVLSLITVPAHFTVMIEAPDQELITQKIPLQTGLINLIDNAFKHHGGSAGNVHISVREEGRYFIFAVDDDGKGVPELSREKIFKLFHRASSSADGHGIGLSVTKRMITSHGGELLLEPQSRLGGACFAIYWPRFEMREEN
jgi:PAS domain S-box-containing protein